VYPRLAVAAEVVVRSIDAMVDTPTAATCPYAAVALCLAMPADTPMAAAVVLYTALFQSLSSPLVDHLSAPAPHPSVVVA